MQYVSKNQTDTINYGKKIAGQLKGGYILLLQGDLGTGKTTLVKGISQGLGIKKEITSPTFSLMNVYNIKTLEHQNLKTLIHIDAYRLKNEEELIAIGVEDYLGEANTVCIIEWPEKITNLLNDKKIKKIRIEHLDNNKREIIFT